MQPSATQATEGDIVKDWTSTGSASTRRGRAWQGIGALLLALGLVLASPAAVGAQAETDEPTTVPDPAAVVPADDDEITTSEPEGTDETDPEVDPEQEPGEDPAEEPAEEEEEDDGVLVIEGERIRIVQTPDEDQSGPCSETPATAMRHTYGGDDEEWRLTIIVKERLCTAIHPTAAIYAMPGNGEAWPQTLVETLDFTIKEAGRTVVHFTKTCDPEQFDVVVGDTPPVIAPLGEWHGQLLFPLDVNSSHQHWGCPPPEVASVTTLPPAEEVAPAELALTGTSSTPVALGGAALLFVGAALLLGFRRRSVV